VKTAIERFPGLRYLIVGIITGSAVISLVTIINLHPYQNVYFNRLAGADYNDVKKRFEVDYWGLTYREALESICRNDSSPHIRVYVANEPGLTNTIMLEPEDRNRISVTVYPELADYFITEYRNHPTDYSMRSKYSIVRKNAEISSTFDLRDVPVIRSQVTLTDLSYHSNRWIKVNESSDAAPDTVSIKSSGEFNLAYEVHADSMLTSAAGSNKYIAFSAFTISDKPFDIRVVFQVDSIDGGNYFWQSGTWTQNTLSEWEYHEWIIRLPKIRNNDVVKVYIWNSDKDEFMITNASLKIISMPASVADKYAMLVRATPVE
jgi:hypothetical protein